MATEINIGENVKKYRGKLGLSQEDFAKKSTVKYTTLTKIESNVIKKPSVLIMVWQNRQSAGCFCRGFIEVSDYENKS